MTILISYPIILNGQKKKLMKRTKQNPQKTTMTEIEIGKIHEALEKVLSNCSELENSTRKHLVIDSLTKASKELHILRLETFKTTENGNTEGI